MHLLSILYRYSEIKPKLFECWIHGVKLIFCEISAFKISFPVHPFQLHFLLKAFNFFLYLSLNLHFCSNIKSLTESVLLLIDHIFFDVYSSQVWNF